jgi:acetyl-CoA carboxylase carboxyl transferase subunit alpha
MVFSAFFELHGDRQYGDDAAVVTGLANLEGRTVVVIGHQKGRTTQERMARRFGMARPEGYRKARRAMNLAEKFGYPLISFIDTPGADPSLEAEERGQAWAIAENLAQMIRLRVPIVAVVIGEGGSGGALAIGISDRLLMLENATYSVVSPEGCASILWNDAGLAADAARAMKLTAFDLAAAGIADTVIPEPEGGAHTDYVQAGAAVREAILRALSEVESASGVSDRLDVDRLLDVRYRRYRSIGVMADAVELTVESATADR